MLVWILQTGEPLHIDKGNPRPMRAMNLSNKLTAAGHSVVLWSSAFYHQEKRHRVKEYTVHKINDKLEIRLIPSCGYQSNIGLKRLFDHFQLAWNLKKILKKEGTMPSIAFVGYPPIETAAVMSRWLKNRDTPVVLDVKDLWPSMFVDAFPKVLQKVARIIFHPYFYLAQQTIKDANGISSMAPAFLEWVLNFSGKSGGQNDKVFRLTSPDQSVGKQKLMVAKKWWDSQGIDSEKPIVSFVGSFMSVFDFNPVYLAAKKMKDCQFVLCGDGGYLDDVKSQMEGLDNVFFPGWVDRSKIEALAEMSIASLAPYKNIENFVVNTPNKIVDSLSLGLPILSPLRGEVKKMINLHKVGLTYDNNLDYCINLLIEDKAFQQRLSTNAKNLYREEFDFDKVYDNLVLHLESMANE